jgi:hypothetical protein
MAASSVRMMIAGIEAMAYFTRINTIRQNGTSISRMLTILEPLVMEVSPFAQTRALAAGQPLCSTIGSLARGRGAASSL